MGAWWPRRGRAGNEPEDEQQRTGSEQAAAASAAAEAAATEAARAQRPPPPPAGASSSAAAARKSRQADRCAAEHVALLHCYQQMTGIGYRSCKDDYRAFWSCMRVAREEAEGGGSGGAGALAAAAGGVGEGAAEQQGAPKTGRAWVALRAFGVEQWERLVGDKEGGGGGGAGGGER